MSDVVEVRPDALAPGGFDPFARALEGAPAGVGQTSPLVGPDGALIELPASIHTLLASVVDILKRR